MLNGKVVTPPPQNNSNNNKSPQYPGPQGTCNLGGYVENQTDKL
jgi:hypothetical protein